jgi:hypothetical protein
MRVRAGIAGTTACAVNYNFDETTAVASKLGKICGRGAFELLRGRVRRADILNCRAQSPSPATAAFLA